MNGMLNSNIYKPVLNTLDELFEFGTIALYTYNELSGFVIQEIKKNHFKISIPQIVNYSIELYSVHPSGIRYVSSTIEDLQLCKYTILIDNKVNKSNPVGMLVIYVDKALHLSILELVHQYIIYLQQELVLPFTANQKKPLNLIVNKQDVVVKLTGIDSKIKSIENYFINKSIRETYSGNVAMLLTKLIYYCRQRNKSYLFICDQQELYTNMLFEMMIRSIDEEHIEISITFFPIGAITQAELINFKLSTFINYAINLLRDKKQKDLLTNIKEIVKELGIINEVDYCHLKVFNHDYDNLFYYTWHKDNVGFYDQIYDIKVDQLLKGHDDQPVIITYPDKHETYKQYDFDVGILLKEGIESFILIPFGRVDKLFGYILLQRTNKTSIWNAEQRNLLFILSGVLSDSLTWYSLKNEMDIKNDRYDTLIEKSPDLLIRFDENFKVIYVNKSIAKYTMKTSDIVGRVLFDEEISSKLFIDKYIEKLHYIQVTCIEYDDSFMTEDGRFIKVRIIPEGFYTGRMTSGMIILSDLTDYMNITREKIKNEEKLKLAIEASNAVIWDINIKTGNIEYSGNINELLDYGSKDDIHIEDIIRPKYFREMKRYIYRYLKELTNNKKKKLYYEIEVNDANNGYKWLLIKGRVTRWDKGNPLNIMGTAIDVTETKNREKKIKFLAEHDSLTNLYNRNYFEKALFEMDMKMNYPIGIMLIDVDGLKVINDAFGHHKGDELIISTGKVLSNTFTKRKCIISRIGGDEFAVILSKTTHEEMEFYTKTINYLLQDECIISITPSVSIGYATKDEQNIKLNSIYKLAEDMMYKRKLLKSTSTRSNIIKSLQKALQEKTHETESHCTRIKFTAIKVAQKMLLSDSLIDDVVLLSNLHDIGKIAIPDSILNKPGKLTDDEWDVMKSHCDIGYRIASSTKDIYSIAEGILSHHERWDGKGYPRGLKELEIPLISRIISVIDAFDAMTHDRIYRKALKMEEAVAEINRNSGSQFDPEIVILFNQILEQEKKQYFK